nr:Chain C, GLY-ILE-VAL-ARG-GLY-ALA [Bacillus subtilis]6S7L_D Chain D, GLY-ILE-VAL-ARG-GLY-ALA [Bacillus subtilis]
GIVRGA